MGVAEAEPVRLAVELLVFVALTTGNEEYLHSCGLRVRILLSAGQFKLAFAVVALVEET